MIVAGFCHNGKLKIKEVSSKTKINSLYNQQNILEPIFEEEIPDVYGKDIDKVEIHKDKVSSNTFNSNATYLAKRESEIGIKCIPSDEILVKSPVASPMNFCAENGIQEL
ncbi:transposase [Trichonephila clavipes]|nr:transposase [Trichonephila clavipes]